MLTSERSANETLTAEIARLTKRVEELENNQHLHSNKGTVINNFTLIKVQQYPCDTHLCVSLPCGLLCGRVGKGHDTLQLKLHQIC